jgi:outer membrane lipoprotein-sorting protein
VKPQAVSLRPLLRSFTGVMRREGFMNRLLSLSAGLPLLTLPVTAAAADPAIDWTLADAMRQVDKQAGDFESAMARVEISRRASNGGEESEAEVETGTAFFGNRGEIRISTDTPEPRVYLLDGRDLYRYFPQAALVEEYSLARHPQMLAAYLRLGFSITGRDLEDDYLVSAIGERFIGDRRTLGLDLTPKRDKDRELVSGIKLWIDQASWMPVEQVIESSSTGQVMTVRYANMARNLKLNPDLFERNWPRGTKKQKIN